MTATGSLPEDLRRLLDEYRRWAAQCLKERADAVTDLQHATKKLEACREENARLERELAEKLRLLDRKCDQLGREALDLEDTA